MKCCLGDHWLEFTLACDMMLNLEGGIRPAIYLAYELVERGFDVNMVSPIISGEVEEHLGEVGITPINLRVKLFSRSLSPPLLWLELWGREALFRLSSMNAGISGVDINFSHTFSISSKFWYVQGPTFASLEDSENELSGFYKYGYEILKPIINYFDKKFVRDMGKKSAFIIANSKFCASIYEKLGIKVEEIIYPPVDREIFHPRTSRPSLDYVLTYFGKETKFSVVEAVADAGVEIKAFGLRLPFMKKSLTEHPNVNFLGRVSTDELIDLYSNALFTLFPFTHEPFGYIPVESMACGTPVLTYDRQGPRESVVPGYAGWLVKSDRELIDMASFLWSQGYDKRIRSNCIEAASKFDKKFYVEKWLEIIKHEVIYNECSNE